MSRKHRARRAPVLRAPRRPALALAAAALSTAGLLTACGTADERGADARSAAVSFEAAVKARDFSAACAALAPQTRAEVESSEEKACPDALAGMDLPQAGRPDRVNVYGRQAQVVTPGDTLFLSQFGAAWKVVAAGCEPQPGRPYECTVKGG
ncbi:hypothetical protein ABZ128_25695 [Streptomyces sp. NPDC006326]|uniref:hypothetical protein n=1 Tax=Streptomyces sp. NPDC006326 TaxID=3156752 RepID=UPI0033ABBA21